MEWDSGECLPGGALWPRRICLNCECCNAIARGFQRPESDTDKIYQQRRLYIVTYVRPGFRGLRECADEEMVVGCDRCVDC